MTYAYFEIFRAVLCRNDLCFDPLNWYQGNWPLFSASLGFFQSLLNFELYEVLQELFSGHKTFEIFIREKVLMFLPCSCFSISPTWTIPRALGMICRCLISLFDASKWRGTGGKLSHPGRESLFIRSPNLFIAVNSI